MDLPTTLETAELGGPAAVVGQAGGQAQPVHRVKSMFQQVALNLLTLISRIYLSFIVVLTFTLQRPVLSFFVAVNGEADTTPPSIPPSASTTLHKPFGGRNY